MPVTNFTLATSEYFKGEQGSKPTERTEWHRVIAWQKTAENIAKYCKKGSQIYIEGKLQTKKWMDKTGENRYTTEIIAHTVQFLDSKEKTEGLGHGENNTNFPPNEPSAPEERAPLSLDDVPF